MNEKSISSVLTSDVTRKWALLANLPPQFRPRLAEAAAQVQTIRRLASLLELDYETTKKRFETYVASRPRSWRDCARAVRCGLPSAIKAMVGNADFPVAKMPERSAASTQVKMGLSWDIDQKAARDAIGRLLEDDLALGFEEKE